MVQKGKNCRGSIVSTYKQLQQNNDDGIYDGFGINRFMENRFTFWPINYYLRASTNIRRRTAVNPENLEFNHSEHFLERIQKPLRCVACHCK